MRNIIQLVATLLLLHGSLTFGQFENLNKDELLEKIKASKAEDLISGNSMENGNAALETNDTSKFDVLKNTLYEPLPDSLFYLPEFSHRKDAGTLPAFGYKFFTYAPENFSPAANVPVPQSYRVGPGDEIIISLWGESELNANPVVRQDGNIYIPTVGLVYVNGLTIKQLKIKLKNVLSKRYETLSGKNNDANTFLDVSTGKIRTVKVYLMGEVNRPGGYTLPAFSSAFTALYFGGGPSLKGSLRNIRILRKGKVISRIDLYDYLLNGDNSSDVQLQDGDIVFIPPAGKRVAVSGAVFRPAIYEMKENEKLGKLMSYTGGLNSNAYHRKLTVERIVPFEEREKYNNGILILDLNFKSIDEIFSSNFDLKNGDLITVDTIDTLYENRLVIAGKVKYPGVYSLKPVGMKVKDLIEQAGGTLPDAFMEKSILIRTFPDKRKAVYSFNIKKALVDDKRDNIELKNMDSVYVFDINEIFPEKTVEIVGQVKHPGKYLKFEGLTLSKLIMMAGGLTDSACYKSVEITRMDTLHHEKFAERILYDLPRNYWDIKPDEDLELINYDRVLVKIDRKKIVPKTVTIVGEVYSPGTYSLLDENEKVFDLVQRAGGLKKTAYKEAFYVKRENKIFDLVKKPDLPDSLFKYKSFFKTSILEGYSDRIPINWDKIVQNPASDENIELEANDTVFIPKNPNVVYVVGEVGIPATVKYKKGASLSYYINQAGGYTQNSDEGNEIVILPNGRKWEPSGFFLVPDPEILPGSVVLVPTIYEIKKDAWPIIRDTFSIISSATIIILTVYNLTR